MKQTTMALFLMTMMFGARAFADCIWTVQSTDKEIAEDEIFKERPQIQKAACSADGAPTCVGYVSCTTATESIRKVGSVACKAIKVGGNWKCPDGQTCYDDKDVSIKNLPKNPEKRAATAPPSGNPGGVRERGN